MSCLTVLKVSLKSSTPSVPVPATSTVTPVLLVPQRTPGHHGNSGHQSESASGSLGGEFYFRPYQHHWYSHRSDYEVNTTRMVAGLRGEIIDEDSFLNNWSWELSYLYTRLDATLRTDSTWNLGRFIRISDPDQCAVDTLCSQVVNPSGALDVIRPGNWTAG